jgi:hypothetical protein
VVLESSALSKVPRTQYSTDGNGWRAVGLGVHSAVNVTVNLGINLPSGPGGRLTSGSGATRLDIL